MPAGHQRPFHSAAPSAPPHPSLDPEALASCRRLTGQRFSLDITRALELALLKPFCLPPISGLLHKSGEFERRPRKRYDDAGHAAIQRMNRMHGAYKICNADFQSILSVFVGVPIRWLERYGWRAFNTEEQQALFRLWRHVGMGNGIAALPTNLEQPLALNQQVESRLFSPATSDRRDGEAPPAMLLDNWPPPLRQPLAVVLRWLLANLRWRLRPTHGSRVYSESPTPSYGVRFSLEQLSPPHQLASLNSPRWKGDQQRIGLTGGIATGKSSVGNLLAARGLPVLDADLFAREALAPGSEGAVAVLARYGDAVRDSDAADKINRAALGQIIFVKAKERRWLEELVHPHVRERITAELERLAAEPTVVVMVPLLFETSTESLCSEVWLVDCDETQQLKRLQHRDHLSEADARARIAAQWPLARKRALADRLIDNRGTPEQLERVVLQMTETMPKKGEEMHNEDNKDITAKPVATRDGH